MDPLREPGDPAVLDGIALRGRLGEGGMGTVYYGITADGDEVAVKTIRDFCVERPALRSRFEREVEAMEMVQGPRVANLIAAAESGEPVPWLAAEYIRGLTLAAMARQVKEWLPAGGGIPSIGVAVPSRRLQTEAETYLAAHRDTTRSAMSANSSRPAPSSSWQPREPATP